ncbi:ATP-binding protein [Streptomyces sp. H10-C2]|uniref:ATP-binding protein n=1 Tax=unclassified Streptomyces TaxID=2593676 RepID=UPI0024BB3BF9|nr:MULTISPECIES: ATP-binding protein [unclassified Streptomyces]MDJ0340377.1 ATP-binding protein [Streptomyces sp. PH10-H1]MDJ0368175.1 ATP-binding protein [Streptomyces sp. H10-C2]
MTTGTDFSLVFPPDPVWVRSAREGVRTLLTATGGGALADTALLLTSEVVTNAVNACHRAGTHSRLTLFAACERPGALRVLVSDDAPGVPSVHPRPGADEEHGRGLPLLSLCATAWGVCRHGPRPGKSVWFELGGPPATV